MKLKFNKVALSVLFLLSLAGVFAVLWMPGAQLLAAAFFGACAGFSGTSLYHTRLNER